MKQLTLHIPLWTLIPAVLVLLGLRLITRRYGDWDFVTPLAGLACLAGACLFLLGRCFA